MSTKERTIKIDDDELEEMEAMLRKLEEEIEELEMYQVEAKAGRMAGEV
jgi:hypothetical protein